MPESFAIKVENLSKAYQTGEIGTGTISKDLERWYARVRGKEDPFLKIGETNDRSIKGKSDVVWSLKDINFEIKQGDAIGIIGRNGAGKSTLLKILSRVTSPTTGKISGIGRIASLLEVGTGFHPELTGKENIYLNGAILGMRKNEIKRKFEEIVDFSGVERYIDTPVKRYSSGMYVRLAFAVAAHLESEILIIDEVLSVGDSEFQKKCLGKMNEVSKGEGRTVLFVSHDMLAVNKLVEKCIFLKNGLIFSFGDKNLIIQDYLEDITQSSTNEYIAIATSINQPYISKIKLFTSNSNNVQVNGKEFKLEVQYILPIKIKKTCITIRINDSRGIGCLDFSFFDDNLNFSSEGEHIIQFWFPNLRLYMGKYTIECFFAEPPSGIFFQHLENICAFEVIMVNKSRGDYEWQPYEATYIEDYKINCIK